MIYFQKFHFPLISIDTGSQMLEIKSEAWKRFCLRFSANNFGETKYQTVMKATAKYTVIQRNIQLSRCPNNTLCKPERWGRGRRETHVHTNERPQ